MDKKINYLARAPWATSSQVIQDDPEAKSPNGLCNCVAELLTSLSILFCQRCTSSRQVGFFLHSSAAFQNKKNFSYVEMIVSVSLTTGLPETFDVLKWVTYEIL